MTESLAVPLPPLRRKILRSFLVVVLTYGILGLLIILAVFLTTGVTPKLIHRNYDSIAAASRMRNAWEGLRHAQDARGSTPGELRMRFQQALLFELGNLTEPGEAEAANEIKRLWDASGGAVSTVPQSIFDRMLALLDRIQSLNEQGMFRLAEETANLRVRVGTGSALLFFLTFCLAFFLADNLAFRLSMPLKEIAEALSHKPMPGEKLKLPTPTSLEMRILTHQMNQLWKRLSELRALNLGELANQRNRLETVLESVEDAILVVDNSENVIGINPGMTAIVGLPREAILGAPWRDLPTSSPNYLGLRSALSPSLSRDNTLELTVDARERVFSGRARPIRTEAGIAIGTLYLLHDLTERRERERLKAEFISVLSHELKTPLQSLGTAAELLARRKEHLSEDGRMLVDTINEDVARIRAVANDFVQVSFVDPHSLRLRIGRHPLSELLADWVKPFRVVAQDKEVKIDYLPEGTVWADIDAVKFPWAVSNLLSNAIRFSPARSTITVALTHDQKQIHIEIRDQGPGIPEDIRQRMFEPYFQSPVAESHRSSGFLGLGLTVAKEVVEAHEGRLEYVSGQSGAIFRIHLPLAGPL